MIRIFKKLLEREPCKGKWERYVECPNPKCKELYENVPNQRGFSSLCGECGELNLASNWPQVVCRERYHYIGEQDVKILDYIEKKEEVGHEP